MASSMRNVVGPRIRQARYRSGTRITQAELAARLQVLGIEVDRTAVSKIETQRRPVTDIELIAICKALGIEVGSLFEEQ